MSLWGPDGDDAPHVSLHDREGTGGSGLGHHMQGCYGLRERASGPEKMIDRWKLHVSKAWI